MGYLRRGKGMVIGVSSWGSQYPITVFPCSYLINKAAFDQSVTGCGAALGEYGITCITLWPGSVRAERSLLAAKRTGAILSDAESARFSGKAVIRLAAAPKTTLNRFNRKIVTCAEILHLDGGNDIDGYHHQDSIFTAVTMQ